ncbi:MAG: MarR family winged helix-turn-helix transcriptional regulator [Steroidobacteraceae bacterium]
MTGRGRMSPACPAPPGTAAEPHLGFLIRRAQQLHVALWARIVSTEISSVQYSILAALGRRGEASQREICDDIDLDRSTVADLVARMERRGLIRRHRDPHDGRRNTVTLTASGRAEHRRLAPLVEQVQHELAAGLAQRDRKALREGLQSLLAASAALRAEPAYDGRATAQLS